MENIVTHKRQKFNDGTIKKFTRILKFQDELEEIKALLVEFLQKILHLGEILWHLVLVLSPEGLFHPEPKVFAIPVFSLDVEIQLQQELIFDFGKFKSLSILVYGIFENGIIVLQSESRKLCRWVLNLKKN